MNEQWIKQLRDLPITVLVCDDLPENFFVSEVVANNDSGWGPSYRIVYSDGRGGKISVEGLTKGIGDIMPGEREESFEHSEYGEGTIVFYGPDSEEGYDFHSKWLSDWIAGTSYGFSGRGVPEGMAAAIGASLCPMS